MCCALHKALTLDPVPVVGDAIYVTEAEGLRLDNLTEEIVQPCPSHKHSFKHAAGLLVRRASRNKRCPCESSSSARRRNRVSDNGGVSSFVRDRPEDAARPRGGGRGTDADGRRRALWAYEMDPVVTAYRWLVRNRSREYPRCCDAVIVYQLKRSRWLPPGLYVYRTRPPHFGCTKERPLTVVDQFNFTVSHSKRFGDREGLPSAIAIEMFPGRDNVSALYVVSRKLSVPVPEYGNRLFAEARALGIAESCLITRAVACEHHEVAMRTERVCVIDLRWKGFDTTSECLRAIPRVRGLQAVVWSNHSGNVQEIESKVLTWLFGLSNELPREVQMIDYKREALGVKYILMDMDTFPGVLPTPPSGDSSFFIHTHFTGDVTLATSGIGDVSGARSRMGSPCPNASPFPFWYSLPDLGHCQPTPFSCGVRRGSASTVTEAFKSSLLEWALEQDGTSCLALAVQHTLYYHAGDAAYKMMVSHTVMDNDATLNIFKL